MNQKENNIWKTCPAVVCINNKSNPASLIVGKVYGRLRDADGEGHGLIRIVDEDTSEHDGYLYPEAMFVPIQLPKAAARVLTTGTRQVKGHLED